MSENKDINKNETKEEAKYKLEKEMKELGIVGVVLDEKNGTIIGITDSGHLKLIDRNTATFIAKNLNIVSPYGNNYALGDKNKEVDGVAEVDATKMKEAEDVSEKVEKNKAEKGQVEEARRGSEELKKEPDGFELALNKVMGGNPDKLKKEIQRGILTPELNTIRNEILTRVAKNMGKSLERTAVNVFKKMNNSHKTAGYP